MRGYLSVPQSETDIPVDSQIGIYRDPEGSHTVFARTPRKEHNLGISDVTVSRLQNETAPVVVRSSQSCLEVHNRRNSNEVKVICDGDTSELEEGQIKRVEDSATLEIGYRAKLRLTVEQEAKTEINVGGDVGGDIVGGNQTNVDERTQVVDSVVNRSEIGDSDTASVEDSVVNRSEIGARDEVSDETDTKSRCERHGLIYTGDRCPKCAAQANSETDTDGESKYCMYCGESIPATASVCPRCDEQFPERS